MLASIIYFVLFSAFIILLNKTEDGNDGFLSLKNHKSQCVARALFVVLIIYSMVIHALLDIDCLAQNPSDAIGLYVALSLIFVIAGIISGFIALGLINLVLWIFE